MRTSSGNGAGCVRVPELPDDARRLEIADRYLTGTRLRLRQVSDGSNVTHKLGHKVRLGDNAAEVAQTSMYLDDAEWDVLVTLPADVVTKARTLVPYDGATVAVDVHRAGRSSPRSTAVRAARGLPAAFGVVREVTDEELFTGAALAVRRNDWTSCILTSRYLRGDRSADPPSTPPRAAARWAERPTPQRGDAMASQDSFGAKSTLDVGGKSYEIFRLDAVTGEGSTRRAARSA